MADILAHKLSPFWQYFRDRGLEREDVQNLGASLASGDRLAGMFPNDSMIASYVEVLNGEAAIIPSVDINGNQTEAFTARLLSTSAFGVGPKTKARFPAKMRPRAHFPRSNPELTKDSVVYLCESTIKAEIVAKCGFFAIGVSGCWGFRDRNTTDKLLSDIRELPWSLIKEIRVFYDSNYATNSQVKAGASDFALRCKQVLNFSGVRVTVLPPAPGGGDWGCDDAFVAMGGSWLRDILDGPTEEPELEEMDIKLMELNEQMCLVQSPHMMVRYDLRSLQDYKLGEFHTQYADWMVTGATPKGDPKQLFVSQAWLRWDRRNVVPYIEMVPYGPKLVPGEYLNCWHDPEVEAKPPSPLWTEFMDNFIEDETSKTWLNQWIASLVQSPGVKLHTYPVLVGPPGTGKTMITSMIESMLGASNVALIGQEDLESSFNGTYAQKMFVGINEFERRRGDHTGIGDKMKRMVTESSTVANTKYGNMRMIKAVANYMITTNNLNALKLEEGDRRAGVIDCTPIVSHYGDVAYFAPLFKLIATDPGAILGYYLSVDMQGFSPFGNAPVTEAKREMTEYTRTPMEGMAWRIVNEKEAFLAELKLPTDICYVSGTLMLDDPRIWRELGLHPGQFNPEIQAGNLGRAMAGVGAPHLANNDRGRVGVRGVKHRVYVLPGGSKHGTRDEVLADIAKWTQKISQG